MSKGRKFTQLSSNFPSLKPETKSLKEIQSKPVSSQTKPAKSNLWCKSGKNCPKGNDCPFAHSKEEHYLAPNHKSTICIHWKTGTCHWQKEPKKCAFAHGEQELKEQD
jgi:hypothetical protein